MIEGTKPYRRREQTPSVIPEKKTQEIVTPPESKPTAQEKSNPENLDRRAWFRSLVPNMGNGLVQILRTSNNFQQDLRDLKDTSEKI